MTDNLTPNRNAAVYPSLVPMGHHVGKPPIALSRPVMLVGSRASAHLHLISSSVSKAHALLIISDGRVYIRDLASRTQVIINGKAVCESDLAAGDVVKIGSFTFKLKIPSAWKTAVRKPKTKPVQLSIDGEIFRLDERVALVGRRRTCDIALMEESVSTAHAVFLEMGGRRFVRDLGSRTGTFVNDHKIHQQEIRTGDKIRIGDTNFSLEEAPARPAGPVPVEAAAAAALMEPLVDDAADLLVEQVQQELEQGLGSAAGTEVVPPVSVLPPMPPANRAPENIAPPADVAPAASQDVPVAHDDLVLDLEPLDTAPASVDEPDKIPSPLTPDDLIIDAGPTSELPAIPVEPAADDLLAFAADQPAIESSDAPVDEPISLAPTDANLPAEVEDESPADAPQAIAPEDSEPAVEPLDFAPLPIDELAAPPAEDLSAVDLSAMDLSGVDLSAPQSPSGQSPSVAEPPTADVLPIADELPPIEPVAVEPATQPVADIAPASAQDITATEPAPQSPIAAEAPIESIDAVAQESVQTPFGFSGMNVVAPAGATDGSIFLDPAHAAPMPIGEQAVLDLLLEPPTEPAIPVADLPPTVQLPVDDAAVHGDAPAADAMLTADVVPVADEPAMDLPPADPIAPSAAEFSAAGAAFDLDMPLVDPANLVNDEIADAAPVDAAPAPIPTVDAPAPIDLNIDLAEDDAHGTRLLPAIPIDQSTEIPPTLSAQIVEPPIEPIPDAIDLDLDEPAASIEPAGDVNADTVAELALDSADTAPLPPGSAELADETSPAVGDQADRLRELARMAAQSPEISEPPVAQGIDPATIHEDEQGILELEPVEDAAVSPEMAEPATPLEVAAEQSELDSPPDSPADVQSALPGEADASAAEPADQLSGDQSVEAGPVPNLDLAGLDFLDDVAEPASDQAMSQDVSVMGIADAPTEPVGATDAVAKIGEDPLDELKVFAPQSDLLDEAIAATPVAEPALPADDSLQAPTSEHGSADQGEMDLESPVLPEASADATDADELVPDDDLLNLAVEEMPDAPPASDVVSQLLPGQTSLDTPGEMTSSDLSPVAADDEVPVDATSAFDATDATAQSEVIEPVEPTPESAQELAHAQDLQLDDALDLSIAPEVDETGLSDTTLGREVSALGNDSPEPIVEYVRPDVPGHVARQDQPAIELSPEDLLPEDQPQELPTGEFSADALAAEALSSDLPSEEDLPEVDLGELQKLEPEIHVELPPDAAEMLGELATPNDLSVQDQVAAEDVPASLDVLTQATGDDSTEFSSLDENDLLNALDESPTEPQAEMPAVQAPAPQPSADVPPPVAHAGDVVVTPLPPRPRLSPRRIEPMVEVPAELIEPADEVATGHRDVDVFSNLSMPAMGTAGDGFEIVIPEMDEPITQIPPHEASVDSAAMGPTAEPTTAEPDQAHLAATQETDAPGATELDSQSDVTGDLAIEPELMDQGGMADDLLAPDQSAAAPDEPPVPMEQLPEAVADVSAELTAGESLPVAEDFSEITLAGNLVAPTDLPELPQDVIDLPADQADVDSVPPADVEQGADAAIGSADDLVIEPEPDLASLDFLPPDSEGSAPEISPEDLLDDPFAQPTAESSADSFPQGIAPEGTPPAEELDLSAAQLLPVDESRIADELPPAPEVAADALPAESDVIPESLLPQPEVDALPPGLADEPLVEEPLPDFSSELSVEASQDASSVDPGSTDQVTGPVDMPAEVFEGELVDSLEPPQEALPAEDILLGETASDEMASDQVVSDEVGIHEIEPGDAVSDQPVQPGEETLSVEEPVAEPETDAPETSQSPAPPAQRTGPQVLFPTLPPSGHTPRSRRKLFNTPMLLLLMLVLIGAAAGVIYGGYVPVSGSVTGRLKFANVASLSVRDQASFWQQQWSILQDESRGNGTDPVLSVRQAALASLAKGNELGTSPGFLGDATAYRAMVSRWLNSQSGDSIGSDELVLRIDTNDPHGDALRIQALLKAAQTRNAQLVDEFNRVDGELKEAIRQQQSVQPQLKANRDKLADLGRSSVPAVSEQDLTALKNKITALSAVIEDETHKMDELVAGIRLLEIQSSPAATQQTQPAVAVNPEEDPQFKTLWQQATDLGRQLDQQRTADAVVAQQARHELDEAFKKVQEQLKAMQAQGKDSPEMANYAKVAKLIQDNAQDLTDQLIKSQTELNTGIANLKQKLEERMEARRKELWANDPELNNLNQLLAYYERSVNAARADANLLPPDQVQQQQQALDDVRKKIDARREQLAQDSIFAQAAKDLQELIDANTKRLANDRQMVAQKLTKMQKDLADAAPTVASLSAEQKAMADAMEKHLAELNAARLSYSKAIDTSAADQSPPRQQLEQKLTALRAQLEGRRQELAAQQKRQDQQQVQAELQKQLEAKRTSLVTIQTQRKNHEAELAQLRTQLATQSLQRTQAIETSASRDELERQTAQLQKTSSELAAKIQSLEARKAAAVYPLPVDRDSVREDVANDPRHKYMVFSMIAAIGLFAPLMLISTLGSTRHRIAHERELAAARRHPPVSDPSPDMDVTAAQPAATATVTSSPAIEG